MNLLAAFALIAAMTSSDAITVLLNRPTACSKNRYAEALEIVRRDARAGKPLQQFVLGVTSDDGEDEAAKEFLEAARGKIAALATEKDNPMAWYLLSIERNDMKMLRRAARLGNVQALNAYGSMLIKGAIDRKASTNVMEKAMAEGLDCFKKAAEKRDPNAYINLGTCYLHGLGCDINLALAHECFKSAAEAGHPEGMDYLSATYEHGHGVEKNHERSLFWRMKARALRGDKAAQEWLKG